jgi:hypothetical protein
MAGPFRRWWFLCPRCRRRCEALYVPPVAVRREWRCRLCWGLIYASQRHGFCHPLRKVLTHRKKITRRQQILRQERQWAQLQEQRGGWTPSHPPSYDEEVIAELQDFGRVLHRQTEAVMEARRIADEQVRALIIGEQPRSRARLRELAETTKSKRIRERARRALERYTPLFEDWVPEGPASPAAWSERDRTAESTARREVIGEVDGSDQP